MPAIFRLFRSIRPQEKWIGCRTSKVLFSPVLGDPVVSPDLKARRGLYDVHPNSSRVATGGSQHDTW